MTLINGAVPATGSDYFAMCFGEHIDKDVDLVILEIAINDQRCVVRLVELTIPLHSLLNRLGLY